MIMMVCSQFGRVLLRLHRQQFSMMSLSTFAKKTSLVGRVRGPVQLLQRMTLMNTHMKHSYITVDEVTRLVSIDGNPPLSHALGDTSIPLLSLTVDGFFRAAVARNPNGPALIAHEQNVRMDFTELERHVAAAARGLVDLGIAKGDRVGVWLPNMYEYIVMQYATARVGAVLTTLNPAYRLPELKHALHLIEAKALLFTPSIATSDYIAMVGELLETVEETVPSLQHVIAVSGPSISDCDMIQQLNNHPQVVAYRDSFERGTRSTDADVATITATLNEHEIANIQFTSGTTGAPKAVALSHHNIVNNGFFIGRTQHFGDQDKVCIPVPLYHCFGVVLGSLACVSASSAIVFPSRTFDAKITLEAVQREKCTALYGVPTMFIKELNLPNFSEFDLSSLRTGIMAGSVCPVKTMSQVLADMNLAEMTIAYGMTETSPVSWQSQLGTPLNKLVSTIGRVHPHVECKVVDPLTYETLPIGETGELCTRGYNIMLGYFNDEEATAEIMAPDGFLKTGDLATIDAEGYCTITGRAKDMIIRGGENISPTQVEAVMRTHPSVEDVSLVGVNDAVLGEILCACVILTSTTHKSEEVADSLREHCRKELAHFKVPTHVRFLDEFPLTASGKVRRFVLAEDSNRVLGLCDVRVGG